MKIAYLLQTHKNWEQLALLIRLLKESWNEIFVHVDAKARFDEEQLHQLIPNIDVRFVQPRVKVYWGHDSQVHATLALLRSAFHAPENFDRFILLSGQDLPIKTNDHIFQFFDNNPHEYLQYYQFPIKWWVYNGYDRLQIYNFPAALGPFWNKINRRIQMLFPFRRPLPFDGALFAGCQWFNLTRGAVEYVLQYVQTTNILNRIKYSSCVDEIFFQSILLNSPFAGTCQCDDLRYADWELHGSNPKTLDQSDLQKLQESTALFARKFDQTHDPAIIQSVMQILEKSPR